MLEWLRFPLAVLVVLIHSAFTSNKADIAYVLGNVLSVTLARIAVPAFFFISGYLFFSKYEQFGTREYVGMLRRKAQSLLIPYIIWNAIAYYGYGLLSQFPSDVQPWEFYKIFWARNDGFLSTSLFGYQFSRLCTPYLGPLWFIRDLMVVMMLSPVIWWICRKCNIWVGGTILLLPYLLNIGVPIKGFGLDALCFFPLGGMLSIKGVRLSRLGRLPHSGVYVAYLSFVAICLCFNISGAGTWYTVVCEKLMKISGIFAILLFAYRQTSSSDCRFVRKLGETSFFIYVFHTLFVFNFIGHITPVLEQVPMMGCTLSYLFSFVVKLGGSIAAYYILKKVCPKALSVLVGGRL